MAKKKDLLLEYEYNEKLKAKSFSDKIREKGKVSTVSDFYPDIDVPETLTFKSGNIPLSHLLLLYEKMVLFIPPSRPEILEAKWSVPFKTVIELCEQNYIIPLIGHAPEYSAPHFESLLKLKPPSIWARGVTLLTELGYGDKLIESNCALPIAQMANVKSVVEKYKQHFPSLTKKELNETIKRELLTYYADLWLFGEGELADCLGSIKDPEIIAERLFLTNELCTKPTLFGLNGTANYDLQTFKSTSTINQQVYSSKDFKIIPKDLDILLQGVDLHFDRLSLQQIKEFHSSGTAIDLRSALNKFENQSKKIIKQNSSTDNLIQEYILSAQQFEQKVKEVGKDLSTPTFRKKISSIEQNIDYGLRMGGVVLGTSLCFLVENPAFGIVTGTSALFDKLLPPFMKDAVIRKYLDKRFYPGLSNMWKILKKKK